MVEKIGKSDRIWDKNLILGINGPGPLNITFGCDMPITLLHLMLMSKVYVVNSDMKNVICMSDPNVMFKGPGPICRKIKLVT